MKVLINLIILTLLISCKSLSPVIEKTQGNIAERKVKREKNSYNEEKNSTDWEITILHTAVNEQYLSLIERNIILELNKVRSDPQKYSKLYLEPLLHRYNGRQFSRGSVTIVTKEGKAAVEECIRELKKSDPMNILVPKENLYKMALFHVEKQGPTGETGHTSPDGKSMIDRTELYIKKYSYVGENIYYGSGSARDIVLQLLIDDGVSSRDHRKNILDRDFEKVGVCLGEHKVFKKMCVMDFLKD